MNRKATVQLISMSLLFVISFVLTLAMFFLAERTLSDFRAKHDLSNAKHQFLAIFSALQEVAYEGYPSQRKIPLSFSTGELEVNNNTILFISEMEENCFAKSLLEDAVGVLSLQTSGVNAYESGIYYIFENDKIVVYFRKLHEVSNHSQVIFKIRRKDIGVETEFRRGDVLINDYLGNETAESQVTLGNSLPEATYSLTVQGKFKYQINYTLRACADYLIISVSCLNCSISKVTYDFVAKIGRGSDDLPYPREGFAFNKNFLCIEDSYSSLAIVAPGDFSVGKVKRIDEYSELRLSSNSKNALLLLFSKGCKNVNITNAYIPPCLDNCPEGKMKLILRLKKGRFRKNFKLMPGDYVLLIRNRGDSENVTEFDVRVI